MPLRHLVRSVAPRASFVCVQPTASASRHPTLKRNLSSTCPAASAMVVPAQQTLPSLKQAWSWLFPENRSSCDCPTHIIPRESKSEPAKTYSKHRERLHQALVDHFHEIEQLYRGNVEYVRSMGEHSPGLLEDLAHEGQKPPFMLIDCSDSRVNEQLIFNAQPGTMFTAGNIANMFDEADSSSNAVLAYAVGTLGVKHVVVLGHYGCGGVAASMEPLPAGFESQIKGSNQQNAASSSSIPEEGAEATCPPPAAADLAVQQWIQPIRHIYETSDRWEIRAHRERAARLRKSGQQNGNGKPIHMHDPAFRALVEENVRENAKRVAESQVIKDHYAALPPAPTPLLAPLPASLAGLIQPQPTPPPSDQASTPSSPSADNAAAPTTPPRNPVYVHGWVYDLESGVVSDLGVSTGPPGWSTPRTYSGGFPYTR